ncbi:MAG: septal ring lytic transglycosylase RlpA family protein [Gammaproteobacteria bacterium]|nr:septal ring lytic transglycosylase RlpA family protein [Gammaproteobacteria bacterium]
MYPLRLIILLTATLLSACGPLHRQDSAPSHIPINPDQVTDAVPRVEPRSRYGNPVSYQQFGKTYTLLKSCKGYRQQGDASWYGTKFHGQRTSSGETYNMFTMSAAHKTLPIPCYARVTNLENGKSIVVRINDRGPFHEGRIIDLSYVAAAKLDMLKKGTTRVEVSVIDPSAPESLPIVQLADNTLSASVSAPSVQENEVDIQPEQGTSSEVSRLYLQVAAYAQRINAEKTQARLATIVAEQIKIRPKKNGLFKLWVGPLKNVEEADKISTLLSSHGYANTHVIID